MGLSGFGGCIGWLWVKDSFPSDKHKKFRQSLLIPGRRIGQTIKEQFLDLIRPEHLCSGSTIYSGSKTTLPWLSYRFPVLTKSLIRMWRQARITIMHC